jgi:short-subunit dehydrogenase
MPIVSQSVARNEERLKSLSARLTSEAGRSVKVLRTDLNNKAELAKLEATLRNDPSVTMLVNNAGIASVAPLLNADVNKMDDIIALNITALTRLTYAAAPAFVARGTGTIINIASMVGISPETLNGVYGATKAYVLALSHSLQHELADKGIRIQAVETNGPALRPRAAPSRSASEIPCRPPDTGLVCPFSSGRDAERVARKRR